MKEEEYLKKLEKSLKETYETALKHLSMGEMEEAEELLKDLEEEIPEFVPLYNKLAVIQIQQERYDKGKALLDKALSIDPDYAPAITNLGSLMREAGDIERAKELYEKAIEVDPEYGLAYNNLGVIYREEGKYYDSVKKLKKARKYGDYHIDMSSDRPIYKEPGCLFAIGMFIILIIFILVMIF